MNIGIDVDGVLTDLASYQQKYGKLYFEDKLKMPLVNPKGYDICDMYVCSKSEREKFWKKYIWAYCLKAPMTTGAVETVRKLKSEGHKIFVITGRAHTTEKGVTGALFRWMLRCWLKKNHFEYDELVFCSEDESSKDKYDICKLYHIDIMLDDKVENLISLKDEIDILCYPAVWNEGCRDLDDYRITSFGELIDKVKAIYRLNPKRKNHISEYADNQII